MTKEIVENRSKSRISAQIFPLWALMRNYTGGSPLISAIDWEVPQFYAGKYRCVAA